MKNQFSYSYDNFTLYRYGDKFKLVYNYVKREGECKKDDTIIAPIIYKDDDVTLSLCDNTSPFDCSNKRFYESLIRTKNTIFGYAMCNDWDYFATFTIDSKKMDRFDIQKFYKKFTQYINNYNRKLDVKIKYLLVPERHKNGAWHMHGFLKDIPINDLKPFQYSEKLPIYLRNKIKNGFSLFSWVGYSQRFGFNDLELINDKCRASTYITKYITKDMLNVENYPNKHLYYCSKGLKKPDKYIVCPKKGTHLTYGYEDDFCKIKWFDSIDDVKRYFDVDIV